MKDVFAEYSPASRPVLKPADAITVHFGIAYTELIELVST